MTPWLAPDPMPALGERGVHVWRIPLRATDTQFDALFALLDEDERARARRFRFDRHRLAFTVSHAATRQILGTYRGDDAAGLVFAYNEHGKPRLSGDGSGPRFNLSHSHELALLAVASELELGVDIEYLKASAKDERLAVAKRFFAAAEYAALRKLPDELIAPAFFACWTRKEAYIKLHGLGLSLPLSKFNVSVDPREPARLLSSAWQPDDEHECLMRDMRVPDGYRASLALHGHELGALCYFDWAFAGGTSAGDCESTA